MSKRKRRMMRRRRISVTFMVIMLMSVMINYALANRLEPEIITVVVRGGESVWSIAKENNPENKDIRRLVYEILDINNIKDGTIYAGQELKIPLG